MFLVLNEEALLSYPLTYLSGSIIITLALNPLASNTKYPQQF